jgi:TetR/AcrR family transcriptional regulator, cholesterol catabolism regulator
MPNTRDIGEPRTETRRKPRDERWGELLEVAAKVFYRKGYDASSLQEIADELGIMKGSLYYYIRSKEDILFALLNNIHQAGIANVAELAASKGTALQRLKRVIVGHIAFIGENLTDTAIFLQEMKALPPERQREILGGDVSYPRIFRQLLADGQADGSIRKSIDADLTATIVLGSLNSTFRWIRQGDAASARRIGEHFADIFASGLEVRPADPVEPTQDAP